MNTTTKAVGMERNLFREDFWSNMTNLFPMIIKLKEIHRLNNC